MNATSHIEEATRMWSRLAAETRAATARIIAEREAGQINVNAKLRTAELLHRSLARSDIRRARAFFNQAAADRQLNQDQIDYVIDCAHDARKDARKHIEAALWAHAKRAAVRVWPRIPEREVAA